MVIFGTAATFRLKAELQLSVWMARGAAGTRTKEETFLGMLFCWFFASSLNPLKLNPHLLRTPSSFYRI